MQSTGPLAHVQSWKQKTEKGWYYTYQSSFPYLIVYQTRLVAVAFNKLDRAGLSSTTVTYIPTFQWRQNTWNIAKLQNFFKLQYRTFTDPWISCLFFSDTPLVVWTVPLSLNNNVVWANMKFMFRTKMEFTGVRVLGMVCQVCDSNISYYITVYELGNGKININFCGKKTSIIISDNQPLDDKSPARTSATI